MIFNSLLGVPAFFIFAGVWRYKSFTVTEWRVLGISTLSIPAMIWFPKGAVLIALFVAAYIFLIQQGYEVWKNGPGVLELSFILTMLLSGACWAAFSFWTGQWIVFWFTLSAAPIWFFMLYKRYTTPP